MKRLYVAHLHHLLLLRSASYRRVVIAPSLWRKGESLRVGRKSPSHRQLGIRSRVEKVLWLERIVPRVLRPKGRRMIAEH